MSMRMVRFLCRHRYRVKKSVRGWIKYYVYDIKFDDEGNTLSCVSDYRSFDKWHRKEIATCDIFNICLRFSPRNYVASVGWDSDLHRFHVRGRSPKNWSLCREIFGRRQKYSSDKKIGKLKPPSQWRLVRQNK